MSKFQTPGSTEGVQHNPHYLYKHFWHSLGKGRKSFQNPKSQICQGSTFQVCPLAILSKDGNSPEPTVFTVPAHLASLKVTPLLALGLIHWPKQNLDRETEIGREKKSKLPKGTPGGDHSSVASAKEEA